MSDSTAVLEHKTDRVGPRWIARMYPGKTGRDHLGLGSVSTDQILPSLSPGINVLTVHPRYHSFYVFVLDEFWRRDLPRTRQAWTRFFRPIAFVFSVGANLCDHPEHGDMSTIVGAQKTAGMARQDRETYDTRFDFIKSPLGGYGLYYRSVMAQMGWILPGGPGFPLAIDLPTDDEGKALAESFRQAVHGTRYFREYLGTTSYEVPKDVIREFIDHACLCRLQRSDAPDRALLRDHFLHYGPQSRDRRATLRMILDIAEQSDGTEIGQDDFRQLLFYGASESGSQYVPRVDVVETYRKWRLYQLREYYSYALNALWCYLCHWGLSQGGDLRPIPQERFMQAVNDSLDWSSVAQIAGAATPDIGSGTPVSCLLAWLADTVGNSIGDIDQACRIDSPINEQRLALHIGESAGTRPDTVTCALTILVLLLARFSDRELWLREDWRDVSRRGANGRLSVHDFFQRYLTRIETSSLTLGEWARDLYQDYVIMQHQLVANSKLPDNTHRFRRQGDGLWFYPLSNSLVLNDSHFDALSTTIHELGLCGDLSLPHHPLTTDGQRLLEDGDL